MFCSLNGLLVSFSSSQFLFFLGFGSFFWWCPVPIAWTAVQLCLVLLWLPFWCWTLLPPLCEQKLFENTFDSCTPNMSRFRSSIYLMHSSIFLPCVLSDAIRMFGLVSIFTFSSSFLCLPCVLSCSILVGRSFARPCVSCDSVTPDPLPWSGEEGAPRTSAFSTAPSGPFKEVCFRKVA